MNILICGAGEIGSHTAEELATRGHHITVIDKDPARLREIEERDVATLLGNCAQFDVLAEAGCERTDLLLATTDSDEVNLLSASIAKGLGAAKSIARVHEAAFFEQKNYSYQKHLGVDQLICPEYSTALEIARTLRNPGALAIENFARGAIEMQEFAVTPRAPAIGKALIELGLPEGSRLAAITRKGGSFIPDAATEIHEDDTVVLVGNENVFQEARRLFHDEKAGRRSVAIMGGPTMAAWLARSLEDRDFSLRIFETNRKRAEAIAEQLDWVTVIHADPTDPSVFEDENLEQVDAFVALLDDDEHNILGCAWAKSRGVRFAAAVVQRSSYMHLLHSVGIDRPFSPRQVAVKEIEAVVDESPLRLISSVAEGIIDVYRVRVGDSSDVIGKSLREINLTPNWIIAAIQHDDTVRVPRAADTIAAGDTIVVIGRRGREGTLRKIFATG